MAVYLDIFANKIICEYSKIFFLMKILHTADWHLGQTFYDYDRFYEHSLFLEWLSERIKDLDIDVLLISGDVFDVSNPSAQAQKMFYNFLHKAKLAQANLQTIIIAGNHDSANRLEAPKVLLEEFNCLVVGALPRLDNREIDYSQVVIPLKDKDGCKRGFCLAIPYLRLGDYANNLSESNDFVKGVETIYKNACDYAFSIKDADDFVIAMGHLHTSGAILSENDYSERNLIGGIELVADNVFDNRLCYTALGHLHRKQIINKRENVRYAGSPLPMSFSELNYTHSVVFVEIDNSSKVIEIKDIAVPKAIELLCIPQSHKPIEDVMLKLAELSEKTDEYDLQKAPYIEVRVLQEAYDPSLRNKIETALDNKQVRLASINNKVAETITEREHYSINSIEELKNLKPNDILHNIYKSKYNKELPDELNEMFEEVLLNVNIDKEEE